MTPIDLIRWLGETSLAVSLLILLVLAIRKPFTNLFGARAAYALWLAPAARLFLPELKILPAPSIQPDTMTWSTIVAPSLEVPVAGMATAASIQFDFTALAAATGLVIWATVAFAWFNIKLEAQSRFVRAKLASSNPAPESIANEARQIASELGLKTLPRIRLSDDETGPCVVGLFKPVIFLPAAFEKGFTRREQYLALTHEIAHVARGDMAATLAALFVQSIQWPNPLAHFAFQKFRTDQEAACDAYVLDRCTSGRNDAGEYAAAIMKSVRAGTSAPAYGLSLAHPVKERLMLLKNQKRNPMRLLAGSASAIAFTAAALGATASYGFQDATETTRIVKNNISVKSVFEADEGESFEVGGEKNIAKVEYENQNGERTLRTYNRRGRLLTENVYAKSEDMPIKEITLNTKDGGARTIPLDRPHKRFHIKTMSSEDAAFSDGDWDIEVMKEGEGHFAFVADDDPNMTRKFAYVVKGGPHGDGFSSLTADCVSTEDGAEPHVFAWQSKDGDSEEQTKVVEHQVVCLNDENGDPEQRAKALKKAIEHMEESAKREAAHREQVIARMREELKELEDKD
ncbi:M56 family metallopeptidase [Hyphococcus flavus]|uniref:M56 family metallopeptidase n=1 Tax=Hyphococcus flavus TaxID=1866326 RepID=A0AAF0CF25_9PROT|nr:M56 family metallopeptidase [Hyphococcus flavus]WDI30944.1 M56 family metallopeptidase [Hyphococcus flavus]